jgi:hypothetical protein
MRLGRLTIAAALLLLSVPLPAAEPDLAALSLQLQSESFTVRQSAERKLTAIGSEIVEQAIASVAPPPTVPPGTDLSDYFAAMSGTVDKELQRQFYDHLAKRLDREGSFRVERVRTHLARERTKRMLPIRAKYPSALSEEEAKLVQGFTGGFRDGGPWFEAAYRNQSASAITSVRIRLRLTNKKTFEKSEQEFVLGSGRDAIVPGGVGKWSTLVDSFRSSEQDYYWQTVAVYGFPLAAEGTQPK